MNYPAELKYSKSHEWVKMEGEVAVIGISDFAQDALGDLVFINLPQEADSPESLNSDPYGSWIIKVEAITDQEELLDAATYEAFCAEEG